MARARGSRAVLSLGLVLGIVLLRGTVFVPPPSVGSAQAKQASLAACAATVLGAAGSAHAAAIGRMIASVPESTTMDVYNSISALVDPKVPAYLMSTVKEADAKAAYGALIDFTNVVKANPITASSPASTVSSSAAVSISAASSKLSAAAYPSRSSCRS